jgi:hypothetical protein
MDRNRVGKHFPNFEKDFETGQQVGSPVMNRGELLHTKCLNHTTANDDHNAQGRA